MENILVRVDGKLYTCRVTTSRRTGGLLAWWKNEWRGVWYCGETSGDRRIYILTEWHEI
jgi:hypothetical protein